MTHGYLLSKDPSSVGKKPKYTYSTRTHTKHSLATRVVSRSNAEMVDYLTTRKQTIRSHHDSQAEDVRYLSLWL